MKREQHGCKNCQHDKWSGAYRVCELRPYDAQTVEQRNIVSWLVTHTKADVNPWNEAFWDCPSFKDYRDAPEGGSP